MLPAYLKFSIPGSDDLDFRNWAASDIQDFPFFHDPCLYPSKALTKLNHKLILNIFSCAKIIFIRQLCYKNIFDQTAFDRWYLIKTKL